jgi:hypothetical protein
MGLPAKKRRLVARCITTARGLDLQSPSPLVGKQFGAEGPRQAVGKFKDVDIIE